MMHILKTLSYLSKIFAVYTLLSVACFLMLRTIVNYASFDTHIQFLARKQDYIGNKLWLTAFYIHVFSAIVALLAGFTQFSTDFLKQHRKFHRLFGRIYVWDILVVNFPTGMIMAIYANGGPMGKTAFILLDSLWFLFTYRAYLFARKRNFAAHKAYMIRSYALTFSAITLRSWKIILSHSFTIDPGTLYIIIAWMGFLPNMAIAELIINFKKLTINQRPNIIGKA